MPISLVILAYGSAIVLAVLLLYRFEPTNYGWHALAVVAAVALGVAPLPVQFTTPEGTLLVGAVFLFLFVWGAFAPVFHKWHYHGPHHPVHHR